MSNRPEAPLIPATAELLEGWCGPVVSTEGWLDVWDPTEMESVWHDEGPAKLRLDLRRPEVQDRVSRVWWGASGAWVITQGRVRSMGAVRLRDRKVASPYPADQARGALYVPALADLPDTDTLAWALWEVWRVRRGGDE